MTTLHLKLLTPTEVVLDFAAQKVIAEAGNGFFCLLPRHVDFLAALVPGILYATGLDGREVYAAIDDGTLVKCGNEVLVSVLNAATGTELAALETTVEESFRRADVDAQRTRSALARLEAATMRRFLEMEQRARG